MIAILERAMAACAKGELRERELLAISLAVNEALPQQIANPQARALYVAFAKTAERKMLELAAELETSKA